MTRVNWNTSRTDVPIFDEALANPRNPHRNFDMRLRWISPQRYIEYQYKTIEKWFQLAPGQTGIEPFWKGVNRPTVERIKKAISENKPFYAFVLEFYKGGEITHYQEGRHRAVAMLELNVKRIPVYFAYSRFKEVPKDKD